MAINPFTKSGSPVAGSIGTTLQKLVNSNTAFRGLVNSMFQASQGSAAPALSVVSNYRTASMQLPKYYKESGFEKVATIQIVNALPNTSTGTQENIGFDAVTVGADTDNQPMNSFLLKRVQESFRERYQIVETFGDDFGVFFTGETPKVFTFHGILINDAYRMWKSLFVLTYASSIRGSELARKRIKAVITYDFITVEGYLFDLQCDTDSLNDVDVPFSFNMLITKYEDLGPDEIGGVPQFGGQVGHPLHTSSSSVLTGVVGTTISKGLPGLQTSPFFSPLMRIIDQIINKAIPQALLASLSKGTVLASNLINLGDINRLPNVINEAISIVSATSTPIAPSTSALLDVFSDAVSGDFSDIVDIITDTSGQFTGQNSPVEAVVSQFNNTLNNKVNSGLIPETLDLSLEARDNLDNVKVTAARAKELLDQTGHGNLANIPLMQSTQSIVDGLSKAK